MERRGRVREPPTRRLALSWNSTAPRAAKNRLSISATRMRGATGYFSASLSDRGEGRRPALVASQSQAAALGQLIEDAPHFATPLKIIRAAMILSRQRQTPLAVPPMLLLGAAGLGKTYVAKQLAALLGSSFYLFAMNAAPSMFMLSGLSTAWRGASPGRIATMLVDGDSASPVCLFDEIDKAMTLSATDRPYDLLHSIFERENGSRFVDDYYDVGFDCSHMISIATANNVDHLPASLLDRLLILRIEMPSLEQRLRLAVRIFDATAKRLGLDQMLPIDNDALAALAELSPRRMTRVLSLALPAVYASGQESVIVHDIRHNARLLELWQSGDRSRIGFLTN